MEIWVEGHLLSARVRADYSQLQVVGVCLPDHGIPVVWFPDPSVMRMRGRGKKGLGNNYRIAGIFRGVIFSWFSWSRGEPRNICTRKSANRVAYRVRAPKTTKFFPRNSQNYDFHENITPRKIPAIRYTLARSHGPRLEFEKKC